MYMFKRNGIYYVQYFDEVKQTRRRVTTKSATKSDALRFVSDLKQKLSNSFQTAPVNLSKVAREYLDQVRLKFSPHYHLLNELTLRLFTETVGDITLNEITRHQVESFILTKYKDSKYSAYLHFRHLRTVFNWCINKDYLKENPLKKFKFPNLPKNNPKFVNETELREILKYVKNETLRDMYLVYFHTGTRRNELIYLERKNVDLENRVIRITNSETFQTKTRRERIIPLNNTAFEIINRKMLGVSVDTKYLFTKNLCRLNEEYVTKSFKKACRLSGYPDIHLHSLRHSFCSNLIKTGVVSIRTVMQLAGHSNLSTTEKYLHVRNESLVEAVRVLENETGTNSVAS